jgi:hypothetical protein
MCQSNGHGIRQSGLSGTIPISSTRLASSDGGATTISDFDPEMLEDYRRSWRDPKMIHGSCSDYRAAASIDLEHDGAGFKRRVTCPTLAFYGSQGVKAKLFDIPAEWRKRCSICRRRRCQAATSSSINFQMRPVRYYCVS